MVYQGSSPWDKTMNFKGCLVEGLARVGPSVFVCFIIGRILFFLKSEKRTIGASAKIFCLLAVWPWMSILTSLGCCDEEIMAPIYLTCVKAVGCIRGPLKFSSRSKIYTNRYRIRARLIYLQYPEGPQDACVTPWVELCLFYGLFHSSNSSTRNWGIFFFLIAEKENIY